PEMKSTGEVMGRGKNFPAAFAKAMTAAGMKLPQSGTVFLSIRDEDKAEALSIARGLADLGFKLVATRGTAKFLESHLLDVEPIQKRHEGSPNCVDRIKKDGFDLMVNTVSDIDAIRDS